MHLVHNVNPPVRGRRVAITGLGVLSACGVGTAALWNGLITSHPTGERAVPDFDPSEWMSTKEARTLDRFTQFALAATKMAIADAGDLSKVEPLDPYRAGIVLGTGIGGFTTIENQILNFAQRGASRVSPRMVPMMMANAASAAAAHELGWHGPSETVVTACAAGPHSIAHAAKMVASGLCDVALGGAVDASLTEVAYAAFGNMTALSTTGHSRPFDTERDGFVMAEGVGVLVLEDYEHARNRNAKIYAELAGTASTNDAYHATAPLPSGHAAAACMRAAIADADLSPDQIAHINAHGTSTPLNDVSEARAINQVFGQPSPPVTSNKGALGHALGASGAVEAVCVALSIDHGVIPPTAGLRNQDPEIDLDIVTSTRPWVPGPVLSNSFGFGGHNGCLVITPSAD
jgi:3-oxoacyl-[acyl-carrier-protein] synthase II